MSTRATYLLPASLYVGHSVCIYVHNDGYPAGAANYFLAMHALKNKTGGLACRFLRAVESAEITLDQDAHDDTEYHYEIDRKGLLMGWKRNIQSREWERLYTGKWYDFVNLYLKALLKINFFALNVSKKLRVFFRSKNKKFCPLFCGFLRSLTAIHRLCADFMRTFPVIVYNGKRCTPNSASQF